ncbi:PaaI family thioesterase [Cupriavidus sp. D384]|uniref:PaaI family thioesterase n=1 Tax=Cupriavidus sp. D384 TaxID=1538095 RepID=UPI0009EF485C|nr:PaaI family thioesterase [Cupriavidus sp. D384]
MTINDMTQTQPLQAAQARLSAQPFTILIGAELVSIGDGTCELKIPIREDLKQQYGFVHGGVVSYAADNSLTIAAALAMNAQVVTSEMKINYIRPAIGDYLVARAQCIHHGKTQAVSRCDVFVASGDGEKLCAVAQGTIVKLAGTQAVGNERI